MNALAMVKESQKNIINHLTEVEMFIAKLYSRFAILLPEHEDFWTHLSNEEETHARMLRTMHKTLEKGNVFYNIGLFDTDVTKTAINLLRHATLTTYDKPITLLQALTTALQVEAMAVENDFYSNVTSDAPEFGIISERLIRDEERHRSILHAAWQDEVLRIPKQKLTRKHQEDLQGLLKDESKAPSMSVRYEKETACIMGEFNGVMDIPMAKHYMERIAHLGGEYYCKRLLNDMRNATTVFSEPVLNDILGLFDSLGIDRSWVRAVLVSDTTTPVDALERMAARSGYTIKLFTNKREAVTWLTSMR